ncbi:glucosamine--fructose-6-phosphate aminotransferase [Streptomyces xiamenensis]|uniref:glucosamine--fructose-6-phosphate aminotransferase n=1 Tax=Streptomyces xiamenensis TaxID=408015 RepID=UPI0036EC86A2
MGGIVGYAGAGGQSAEDVLLRGLEGLGRLGPGRLGEPVGAEGLAGSAGVVVSADGGLGAAWGGPGGLSGPVGPGGASPAVERLREELERRPLPAGMCGIGGLGGVPGLDGAGRVAVVLAGAVDVGAPAGVRAAAAGAVAGPAGDAGVVARLVAEAFSSCGELGEAVRQVRRVLADGFAVLVVHADEPDTVVGAAAGVPLVVGAADGAVRLASDAGAWGDGAGESVVVKGDQMVLVRREFDEVRWEITDGWGVVVAP